MDGLLIVDKPEGITSAEVVRRVKRIAGDKVGHLGTLDPFASGVLPLCLGEGTKIAQFLNTAEKSYEGVIRLGIRTDSGDRTGEEVERQPVPPLESQTVAATAAAFVGDRMQTPPMYSAVKKSGVPLYKLARRGVEVEREPRQVRIDALQLEIVDAEHLRFQVDVSKGTYVRVLAEEIGTALGTVAHLETLRRTRFGSFTLDRAVTLPLDEAQMAAALLSPAAAIADLPEHPIDAATELAVRRGQVHILARLPCPADHPASMKLVAADGSLVAVVVSTADRRWAFARVLNS